MENRPESQADHKRFKPLIQNLIKSLNFQYRGVYWGKDSRGLIVAGITLNPEWGELVKRIEPEIVTKLRNSLVESFVVEEDLKKILKSFNWNRPS